MTKKRHVLPNVTKAMKLVQELLRSSDVVADGVPYSEARVTTRGDATELSIELEKAKRRITKLEYVKRITVSWHQQLMDEVMQRHAKEVRP